MLKKPSITELEIRTIRFFLEHMGEEFALRELSREAKTDHKLIYLTVQKLVKKGVLLKKRQANIDICSLNLQSHSNMLSKDSSHTRFVPFYLNNSRMSFLLTTHAFKLSTDAETKKSAGFPVDTEKWHLRRNIYKLSFFLKTNKS